MVSIEGIVTAAGPVTLVTVRACVSLVPETADATYPNVAPRAVLLSAKAAAVLLRLSTVKTPPVVPEDVIEVYPVALMRSKVAVAVPVIVRVSMDVNVGVIVPAVNEAVRVSVPFPPASVSAEFSVAKAPVVPPNEPSKESVPPPPVKVLIPVVRVLNWFPKKFNKHRHLACYRG
jgi:hypothetical protein